jgi:hypothetical protein
MRNNKRTHRLNIPGISPVIINGKRYIRVEAMCKRFITNKYIKCLYDICRCWNDSYHILDTLVRHEIIKQNADHSLEWTLTKTSLACLFKKMDTIDYEDDEDDENGYACHIPGGFWNPISTLFGIKRDTLKKLAHNKITYGGQSKDMEKLNAILKENGIQL